MVASSRWSAKCAVLIATLGLAPTARGDEPSRAELLFQDARTLIAQKRYDEACAKLVESEALDPGIGTQFNLARCYELSGHLANARAVYERVVSETHAAGQTAREGAAQARIEQLEPRLSRVRVTLAAGADLVGLEVLLDSAPLPRDAWNAARFVDPGLHEVRATAPGRHPLGLALEVTEGAEALLEIPPLVELEPRPASAPAGAASNAVPPPPIGAAERSAGSPRRTIAFVVGGVGIAALGTGLAFGAYSWVLHAGANCQGNVCDAQGFSARTDAIQAGNVATALVVGGAVAIAAGVVLLVTGKGAGHRTSSLRAAPMVAADRGGVVLGGEW